MYVKFSILLFLYCWVAVKCEEIEWQSRIRQLQCDCGRANERTSKIIGGAVVTAYKYPWMVTVLADKLFCGGALLTRKYVLTSAHCVDNRKDVSVGIAVHDRKKPGEIIPASIIKIHPGHKEIESYDIALIKLQRAVEISERVGTLCLPHNLKYERPGKNAIVAGWGMTHRENWNSRSQFLKEANLTILRADWVILAEGENHTGACYGDSGSPLFTKYANEKYHVIGVTSRINDPCMGSSYYERVFLHTPWILHNIKDSPSCARDNSQIDPVASNRL